MAELNAWFARHAPGLSATAGYPADAKRWRRELAERMNPDAALLDRIWRIK